MAAGDVEVNITSNHSLAGAFFDGVDDRMSATITNFTENFEIEFDILSTKDGVFQLILNNGGFDGILIRKEDNNKIMIRLKYSDASDSGEKEIALPNGVWVNYKVTWDPSLGSDNLKAYLDGVQINQWTTGAGKTIKSRTGLTMSDVAQPFAGNISNIKISTNSELIHRWKLYSDYVDTIGGADFTNIGTTFVIAEDAIAAAIKADRTTANDKYMMVEIAGQIISTVIEEAP